MSLIHAFVGSNPTCPVSLSIDKWTSKTDGKISQKFTFQSMQQSLLSMINLMVLPSTIRYGLLAQLVRATGSIAGQSSVQVG